MIHLALLDDHPAVLAGLRRLIEPETDLSIVAAAASAPELVRKLCDVRPDVLILDYDFARADGLSLCRRVKERAQAPRVVIYSSYASPALSLAARAAQADGLVDKRQPVSHLLDVIRRVAAGETSLAPVPRDAYEAAVSRLDDEDLPVLALLLDGESLAAIAEALRTDRGEIAWRAQRLVARLRPRDRTRWEERALERTTPGTPFL